MPAIVPNWHPLAVHFPIALATTAGLLLLAGHLLPRATALPTAGRLLILLAAPSAVIASLLGWHAFQSVEHDAAGHAVMIRHRTWALTSTASLLLLALWDGRRWLAGRAPSRLVTAASLAVIGGLGMTGWLGGEMVYRHGIGILPSAFAVPTAAPLPADLPPVPAVAAAATPPAGEHIHKDGKRHRH